MAIATAVQRGSQVCVYDENNRQIWYTTGELQGYTSTTITVKVGTQLFIYNDKHQLQYTKSV